MSNESAALDALKYILAGINPTPEPTPRKVWVYPADWQSISFERLPVVVVSKIINREIPWSRQSHGRGKHIWPAEILVFLADGPITNDEMAARLEGRAEPWPLALSDLLFSNSRLENTVTALGGDDALFTYQVGHIHFWNKIFFGVRFELPIRQDVAQVQAR